MRTPQDREHELQEADEAEDERARDATFQREQEEADYQREIAWCWDED